jgi:hypothetical protein
MNPIIKEHLLSAATTFITTFVVILGVSLQAGPVEWTGAFWAGVILVSVRAAFKEVLARSLPKALGGRRK